MHDIYTLFKPEHPSAVIFDSPHSGRIYPADFNPANAVTSLDLALAEDRFVDELFAGAPDHGATLLCALFPRTYIDPNRAEDDLDPLVIEGPWPGGEISISERSKLGIGLIRRLLTPEQPLYDHPLPPEDIRRRIENHYRSYHEILQNSIIDLRKRYEQIYHVNCHSMPSSSAHPTQPRSINGAVDFVLSNRDGRTCSVTFVRHIKTILSDLGYSVSINDPYKGAEIIERIGDPLNGINSLQIEINRALYLNENKAEKSKNFDKLKRDIDTLVSEIVKGV